MIDVSTAIILGRARTFGAEQSLQEDWDSDESDAGRQGWGKLL